MKWWIPAFGTSLIVFIVIFAGIEAKQMRDEESARRSQIESEAALASPEEASPEVDRDTQLGAVESNGSSGSTIARAEKLSPPPPPPPGPPNPEFEAALEDELQDLRPALISPRSFSRAAPRPRHSFDLTRVELRPEDRGTIEASFILSAISHEEAPSRRQPTGAWRLDVRADENGAMVYRTQHDTWAAMSGLLRHPRGRVSALPAIEDAPPPRYRYRGEHFRTLTGEMVRIPLEKRSEMLGHEALFARSVTAMTTFTITLNDEHTPEDPEADLICQLQANTGFGGIDIEGDQLEVPVRYDVARGAFEVKVEDSWRDLAQWAKKMRPHTELITGQPLEDPNELLVRVKWKHES